MKCPKCGSENVNVQMVTETNLKTVHHGLFWWLFIGWWWWPIKWLVFTIPAPGAIQGPGLPPVLCVPCRLQTYNSIFYGKV